MTPAEAPDAERAVPWPVPRDAAVLDGAQLRTQVALDAVARRAQAAVDVPRRRWSIQPRVALAAGAVVLALACVVVLRTVAPSRPTVLASVDQPAVAGEPASAAAPTPAAGGEVVVHVVGEVASPGVVRLPAGSRVVDAVDAAGGATSAAQLAGLNLARVLVDGEQVVVPGPATAPAAAGGGAGAAGVPDAADGRLDLNTADEAALDALPGIGPVLAGRIVAWRDEHGRFSAVDELAEVDGIGPAVLSSIRDLVRV